MLTVKAKMLHEKKIADLRFKLDMIDAEERWKETLKALLELVSEQDEKMMTSVLQQQWDFLQHQKRHTRNIDTSASGNIPFIIIPAVRRIFDDFPIKHLVGVQPISKLVDTVYSLEVCYNDLPLSENKLGINNAKKICIEIIKNDVECASRKLPAIWTPTTEGELMHARGLDIECEKTQVLSHEIRADITNEILSDLKALAKETEVVKLKGIESEQLHLLGCRIRSNCSMIAMTTRRAAGNWIVVSKAMASFLSKEQTANIEIKDDYKSKNSEMLEVGTISDTIRVFVADVKDDEILAGYRGKSETDTGYIYCPHTPLMTGGWTIDPIKFDARLSFFTRYGKFTTDNVKAYYRNIKVESDLLNKIKEL